MKLDYCATHSGGVVGQQDLSCLRIRDDDGNVLSAREVWAEIERLRAERDAFRDAATARDRNEDALRADVERLNQMLRDNGLGQGEIDAWANAIEERDALRDMLADAADEIESWGAYASPYFQTKHNLAGTLKRFRDAAMKEKP